MGSVKTIKFVVKAIPEMGLWAYGRYFKHDVQEQLELPEPEYLEIAKSPYLVSVVIPEAEYKLKGSK